MLCVRWSLHTMRSSSAHHAGLDAVKVAVIVNDMAEINIDSQLVTQGGSHREGIVELTNGCICCTLRDDLVQVRAPLFNICCLAWCG